MRRFRERLFGPSATSGRLQRVLLVQVNLGNYEHIIDL